MFEHIQDFFVNSAKFDIGNCATTILKITLVDWIP